MTAMGAARIRRPRRARKVHRQAFIYVISSGPHRRRRREVDKIDGIRRAWETFFSAATEGRMRAETRLRPPS